MCVTLFMGGRPGLAQLAADAQITTLIDKTLGRPRAFNEDKPLCSGDGRVINNRTIQTYVILPDGYQGMVRLHNTMQ